MIRVFMMMMIIIEFVDYEGKNRMGRREKKRPLEKKMRKKSWDF